jgi:hypothetical protein
MAAFTNRKYPVLNVVEVGGSESVQDANDLVLELTESVKLHVKPVYVQNNTSDKRALQRRHPVAIAAVFETTSETECSVAAASAVAVLPIEGRGLSAGSFLTDPSVNDLAQWASSFGSPKKSSCNALALALALFVPLSIHAAGLNIRSFNDNGCGVGIDGTDGVDGALRIAITIAITGAYPNHGAEALGRTLRSTCAQHNLIGIRLDVSIAFENSYRIGRTI